MSNSNMVVYRPIKSNYKSQGFGDNKPFCKLGSNGQPIRPYVISSYVPVGEEDKWTKFYPTMGLKGHNGEDWSAWSGEPLYFPVDCPEAGGWFARDASDLDGGLGVDVISKNPINIDGKLTYVLFRFWHLKKAWKDVDVQLGELIGYCDNTGASSGDHLHWSMKFCNSNGYSTDEGNGYYGAKDFSPYFENEFVLDVIKIKAQALSAIDYANKFIFQLRKYISEILK